MGSYSEPMTFDPEQCQLQPKSEAVAVQPTVNRDVPSGQLPDDWQFDPGTSRLRPEASIPQYPKPKDIEHKDVKFNPAASRLQPKVEDIEESLRRPKSGSTHRFNKKTGSLAVGGDNETVTGRNSKKTEKKTPRPVAVDMNRRTTGGFF